jgi:hypothetical protein
MARTFMRSSFEAMKCPREVMMSAYDTSKLETLNIVMMSANDTSKLKTLIMVFGFAINSLRHRAQLSESESHPTPKLLSTQTSQNLVPHKTQPT